MLDVPGQTGLLPGTFIHDIDNRRCLVGYYGDDLTRTFKPGIHGFLASPVPEPPALALVGIGLLVMWRFRRRRSRSASCCRNPAGRCRRRPESSVSRSWSVFSSLRFGDGLPRFRLITVRDIKHRQQEQIEPGKAEHSREHDSRSEPKPDAGDEGGEIGVIARRPRQGGRTAHLAFPDEADVRPEFCSIS